MQWNNVRFLPRTATYIVYILIRHNTNYCNIWRQTVDAKELTEGFVLDSVNVVPLTVMTREN